MKQQQQSIFSFDPQQATWTAAPWEGENYCVVTAIVPAHIKSPGERHPLRIDSDQWREQQAEWVSVVSAIAGATLSIERHKDDINGWERGMNLMEHHRDIQEPVKMLIWERESEKFRHMEIISYGG